MMVWFETILVTLTALTGLIWLLDRLFFAKRRAAAAGVLEEAKEPVVVDYAKAFFPILALVLGLRSFVAEPFRIPSSSMMPTLLIGDFILVNKFAYGLRWPITNKKFLDNGEPQRGDVVVFDSPADGTRLIKRVVAVAGDRVELRDGHLSINGVPMADAADPQAERFGLRVALLDLANGGGPDILDARVPAGHVLVLGDHRGRSVDGRWFGFVPVDALYARALAVYWRSGDGLGWRRL